MPAAVICTSRVLADVQSSPTAQVECVLYEENASTKRALPLSEKERLNPGFVECSPLGLVPALCDHRRGDAAIHDSAVVVEYIDCAFEGPALLPEDPVERARVRAACAFFEDKARSHFYKILMAQDAAGQAAAAAALSETWAALAGMMAPLVDGPFFLGDRFSLFECIVLPWFIRAKCQTPPYAIIVPKHQAELTQLEPHPWQVSSPSLGPTAATRCRDAAKTCVGTGFTPGLTRASHGPPLRQRSRSESASSTAVRCDLAAA